MPTNTDKADALSIVANYLRTVAEGDGDASAAAGFLPRVRAMLEGPSAAPTPRTYAWKSVTAGDYAGAGNSAQFARDLIHNMQWASTPKEIQDAKDQLAYALGARVITSKQGDAVRAAIGSKATPTTPPSDPAAVLRTLQPGMAVTITPSRGKAVKRMVAEGFDPSTGYVYMEPTHQGKTRGVRVFGSLRLTGGRVVWQPTMKSQAVYVSELAATGAPAPQEALPAAPASLDDKKEAWRKLLIPGFVYRDKQGRLWPYRGMVLERSIPGGNPEVRAVMDGELSGTAFGDVEVAVDDLAADPVGVVGFRVINGHKKMAMRPITSIEARLGRVSAPPLKGTGGHYVKRLAQDAMDPGAVSVSIEAQNAGAAALRRAQAAGFIQSNPSGLTEEEARFIWKTYGTNPPAPAPQEKPLLTYADLDEAIREHNARVAAAWNKRDSGAIPGLQEQYEKLQPLWLKATGGTGVGPDKPRLPEKATGPLPLPTENHQLAQPRANKRAFRLLSDAWQAGPRTAGPDKGQIVVGHPSVQRAAEDIGYQSGDTLQRLLQGDGWLAYGAERWGESGLGSGGQFSLVLTEKAKRLFASQEAAPAPQEVPPLGAAPDAPLLLEVRISPSINNPNVPITGTHYVPVTGDLVALSEAWGRFIRDNDLSGSNVGGTTRILDAKTRQEVGRISYNGKVWPPGEWKPGDTPLYDPRAPAPQEAIPAPGLLSAESDHPPAVAAFIYSMEDKAYGKAEGIIRSAIYGSLKDRSAFLSGVNERLVALGLPFIQAAIKDEVGKETKGVLRAALHTIIGRPLWMRKDSIKREDGAERNITVGTRVVTLRQRQKGTQAGVAAGLHGVVEQAASGNSAAQREAKKAIGTTAAVLVRLDPVGAPPPPKKEEPKENASSIPWVVTSADRDGKPTEREWREPLGLSHVTIIDEVNKPDRYGVFYKERRHHAVGGTREVLVPSGIRWPTQAKLREFLASLEEAAEPADPVKPLPTGDALRTANRWGFERMYDDIARRAASTPITLDEYRNDPGLKSHLERLALAGVLQQEGYTFTRAKKTPTLAVPEEIPLEAAVRAHEGVSQVPEQRGKAARRAYATDFNSWAQEQEAKADTTEETALVDEIVAETKVRFRSAFMVYLSAKGRTTSWLVTGPAGRDNRREGKKNDTADRRFDDAQAVLEQGTRRVDGALKALRGRRAAEAAGYDPDALTRAQVEAAATKGRAERFVERATATGRASSTDVRAKARRAAELQAKLEAPDEATEHPFPAVEERPQSFGLPLPAFPAGKVEYDRADDRLRIHFDERQGKDGTRALKGDGWRWSRRNTAWQRQLTNNAVWSASRLLGIDLPSLDTSALQQAEDEAARKVQEARKARKAAAREGEGTFWDVLDAAMRKGSQFKLLLPKDIDSPKAGKKVSPSMSTWKSWGRSAPGFNFIYRTKEAGRSKWSPGGRLVIAMLKNLGDGQWQVRAFTNPYYPNESWVEGKDVTFTMPDSPTAEDVPTAVAAFKKLITSFGDLSNVPKL